VDRSFGDLELESMHGFIIFGYDDESARVLVETMNDTGAFDTVDDRGITGFFVFHSLP
jgi:hypothetical protein